MYFFMTFFIFSEILDEKWSFKFSLEQSPNCIPDFYLADWPDFAAAV